MVTSLGDDKARCCHRRRQKVIENEYEIDFYVCVFTGGWSPDLTNTVLLGRNSRHGGSKYKKYKGKKREGQGVSVVPTLVGIASHKTHQRVHFQKRSLALQPKM